MAQPVAEHTTALEALLARADVPADVRRALTEHLQAVASEEAAHRAEEARRARDADELRALSLHLQSAREEERASAARRIHDELGQVLTALKIDAAWMGRHLPPDRADLAAKAAEMLDLVGSTIRTVQTLCTELRPQILDDLGIGAALEWQAVEFAKRTGLTCNLQVVPEELTLDRERSTAVFRICQEALANVARHSRARSVEIALVRGPRTIALTVADDGRGITQAEIERPGAMGLLQIRQRVAAFGGALALKGEPGAGTRLVVELPLAEG